MHRDPATTAGCRAEWQIPVTLADGHSSDWPCAFSFYSPRQVLRLWVLIDSWTWELLIDPMDRGTSPPSAWDLDPRTGVPALQWIGGGRFLGFADRLEQDGWLDQLEAAESARHWFDARVHSPEWARWDAGMSMPFEERVAIQRPLLTDRYRRYGRRWRDESDQFRQYVRDLWEFYLCAERERLTEVTAHLRKRLDGAVLWMMGMYGINFDQVCERVGPGPLLDHTLPQIFRPAWYRTVEWARIHMQPYIPGFNEVMQLSTITKDDVEAFVQYLDDNGLAVWCSEFAALNEEYSRPTDLTWDHRIRAIASLASLCEPILLSLVDRYGLQSDRNQLSARGNKARFLAFLRGRPDAMDRLAELIDDRWVEFTQTTETSLPQVLAEIDDAAFPAEIAGPARVIFRLGAIRNFGSHRFDADPEWLSRYQNSLAQAVVLCPLLYWKLATTQ